MSEFKVLGQTIEEFMIRWNAVTFQLGGLNEDYAKFLSKKYIDQFKLSLKKNKLNIQDFFLNLSRGGSISTIPVEEATNQFTIKEFYKYNLWGTSIPYALPIALQMSPSINGKKILDIGCGFGRLSLLCALKKADQVIAIDLSEPLIDTLNNVVKELKLTNLKATRIDAEELIFEENEFDIIFFCEVIEHLPNPGKTLRSIHRCLKPGGSLILSTPNGLTLVGFKQRFLKCFGINWTSPYGAGQPELYMFSPFTIKALLAKYGFEIKQLRGAELLDNLAILYPGTLATGLLQFLPLLFPFAQQFKNGFVSLGKTRIFKYLGLEMFIHAIPTSR